VQLTDHALDLLTAYDGPGKLRELRKRDRTRRHSVQRGPSPSTWCSARARDFAARRCDLRRSASGWDAISRGARCFPQPNWLTRERDNTIAALDRAGWKVSGPGGAAEMLGVKPTTLASRLKRFGIERRH